jgi:3-(3-hydroxy-phenyl)propionate hydroxylase
MTEADLAIIGFGPVGCTLAALAARRGLRTVVLERDVDLFAIPRAAHFDGEIARTLHEVGCMDEITPAVRVNAGMDFLTADRQVLLSMRSAPTSPSGWPGSQMFHQPGLERPLRAAANRLGADVRLGTTVVSIDHDEQAVSLGLDDGSTVQAAWVVACDGARSTARKLLGVTMDDLQFEEPWLVLDLILHPGTSEPSAVALQVCDPARPHTLVPMPAPRFRFEFMLLAGEDPEWIQRPEVMNELLAAWVDPAMVTVERAAVYTFHGLIAQQWRSGRVLLAGDAAHQMPPFLGQGMCSGMRDAANLAWKLDAVVHGADPALLDTYQAERAPHVRSIIESAVGFGRLICTTDRAVAANRDESMLAARAAQPPDQHEQRNDGAPMPALGASPLVLDGGGRPAVQSTVDGRRFDDLVGQRFAVVARTADLLHSDAAEAWAALGAVLLTGCDDLLDRAGGDVAVVRPDRYLLAAGNACPPPPALLGRR